MEQRTDPVCLFQIHPYTLERKFRCIRQQHVKLFRCHQKSQSAHQTIKQQRQKRDLHEKIIFPVD